MSKSMFIVYIHLNILIPSERLIAFKPYVTYLNVFLNKFVLSDYNFLM